MKRPALPEDLVNLAARAGIDRVEMFRVNLVDEILAVEKLRDEIFPARFKNAATLPRELRVARFIGHFRRRRERREIQPAQPRHRPEPIGVERVVLVALDEAVVVGVLGDEPLRGQLDLRPVAFEKFRVRRHLMFAQRAQNRPRLRVHGGNIVELAAKMNRPVGLCARPKSMLSRVLAFQFGKQPRRRMGIMINMAAGSLATAHAFPAVKPPVRKTETRGGGEDGGVQKRPVQKPERQRRIIPGVAPQPRLARQPVEICAATYCATACAEENFVA